MSEQDKRKEYIALKDEFKVKKDGLLEQISRHQSGIARLRKEIDEARPKTENGRMTCDDCDCISMKYLGRTPQGGLSGGDDIYECEICKRFY